MMDEYESDENLREALVEQGRLLFAQEISFIWGAQSLGDLPAIELPEIAFAGRSNVGKSSLLNALTNRHSLARASNTPGRTQQLNFFDLAHRVVLVDMPGYGYAKAPKEIVKKWTNLVFSYLRGRSSLKRTCLLVDARHGIKDNDREMMSLLDKAAVVYQVVLTKADKVGIEALAKLRQDVEAELARRPAAYPEIFVTSSEKGLGIAELRASLAALALPARG